jgi:nitrogen fixation/metabolism regulation signal transduction histidine kinase
LEKARCDHIKAIAQAKSAFSVDDTKDPSAEATLMGGEFYNDVWVNGGRELTHEIIKKSEKDTHDARAEAKRGEETAERGRRIGIIFIFYYIFFGFLASVLALWLRSNQFFLLQLNYLRCRNCTIP